MVYVKTTSELDKANRRKRTQEKGQESETRSLAHSGIPVNWKPHYEHRGLGTELLRP